MFTKFETRSNRVKGLSFHAKRPWILASLHNGAIQLWDYRMGTLIDRFEEHEGPVRGVHFHSSQPLFCSGGDDYKIKVWNHKLRRCLFTLLGHLDYIRTVQFHHEQPWIVSASDDQTLRIWNWQSRSCISVLTGHNHYVMSAQFNPREDLVISSSLDQTLRVWDISGLKKQKSNTTEILNVNINQELFGGNDVIVKLILEGHEKGVNWAAFHPSHPLIVSGSDDRSIRIWKMDDARGFEIEQLRGHVNNVSCVMYFKDYIISNSEDRSIRVWDVKQRSAVHTFRRDSDRFWMLAVHPEKNLIAAGHDTGTVVFKLERERPASCMVGNTLYWVRDRQLRSYDFDTRQEDLLLQLRRNAYPPVTLSYCQSERMALFYYDYDGGTFELYQIPKSGINPEDVKKGFYISAVFFSRNKFAALDKNKQVVIRNTKNDILKVLPAIGQQADFLFPAGNGQVLARNEDKVSLYDITQKKVIGECSASKVKYAVWHHTPDGAARVALLSKYNIVIAGRKLKQICSLHENSRIKSAAFDENGVLMYSTLNHLKYCLPTGDTGTIRTLENPIYLVRVVGDTLHYIDREGRLESMVVDSTEYKFKSALAQEQYKEVMRIVKKTTIHGQALVAYLQQKNFPEVAMHFVKDNRVRFNLAVECGNLDIAKETAQQLNDPDCWRMLGAIAMKHGNVGLVELACSRTGEWDKLAFLYLMCGNKEKLENLITDTSKVDTNTRFQFAMFLGDVGTQLKILEDTHQYSLAHALARNNGMEEKAEELLNSAKKALVSGIAAASGEAAEVNTEELEEELGATLQANANRTPTSSLLQPPAARCDMDNWPLLPMERNIFTMLETNREKSHLAVDEGSDDEDNAGWPGETLDELDSDDGDAPPIEAEDREGSDIDPLDDEDGGAWPGDEDLEGLEGLDEVDLKVAGPGGDFFFPSQGNTYAKQWVHASSLPIDHIAAGAFESALPLLKRQCGIMDFAPLKDLCMNIWMSANASLPVSPLLPAQMIQLNRTSDGSGPKIRGRPASLPAVAGSLSIVADKLKKAHKMTTEGQFPEAIKEFRDMMYRCIFIVLSDKKELTQLKDYLSVSREYVSALRLEEAKKDTTDIARQLELSAYFTHANLQPVHTQRTLVAAMSGAYKNKNYKSAASFAKRLLELHPSQKASQQARKVIQFSETNSSDQFDINYDERNPFVVCGTSLSPIYRGQDSIRCAFCFQPFKPQHANTLCPVCCIGEVGGEAIGMQNTYNAD